VTFWAQATRRCFRIYCDVTAIFKPRQASSVHYVGSIGGNISSDHIFGSDSARLGPEHFQEKRRGETTVEAGKEIDVTVSVQEEDDISVRDVKPCVFRQPGRGQEVKIVRRKKVGQEIERRPDEDTGKKNLKCLFGRKTWHINATNSTYSTKVAADIIKPFMF